VVELTYNDITPLHASRYLPTSVTNVLGNLISARRNDIRFLPKPQFNKKISDSLATAIVSNSKHPEFAESFF
jgi:hypothetical protein